MDTTQPLAKAVIIRPNLRQSLAEHFEREYGSEAGDMLRRNAFSHDLGIDY